VTSIKVSKQLNDLLCSLIKHLHLQLSSACLLSNALFLKSPHSQVAPLKLELTLELAFRKTIHLDTSPPGS
ncbi:hypothetical protein ATANTOWER_020613, partial [Ataeniobius toweri]|nr:hypothetical protein [Ataeniobius toweri]